MIITILFSIYANCQSYIKSLVINSIGYTLNRDVHNDSELLNKSLVVINGNLTDSINSLADMLISSNGKRDAIEMAATSIIEILGNYIKSYSKDSMNLNFIKDELKRDPILSILGDALSVSTFRQASTAYKNHLIGTLLPVVIARGVNLMNYTVSVYDEREDSINQIRKSGNTAMLLTGSAIFEPYEEKKLKDFPLLKFYVFNEPYGHTGDFDRFERFERLVKSRNGIAYNKLRRAKGVSYYHYLLSILSVQDSFLNMPDSHTFKFIASEKARAKQDLISIIIHMEQGRLERDMSIKLNKSSGDLWTIVIKLLPLADVLTLVLTEPKSFKIEEVPDFKAVSDYKEVKDIDFDIKDASKIILSLMVEQVRELLIQ